MDKILLIDAMNSIWRASVGFGQKKGSSEHKLCTDCDRYYLLHASNQPHCECGGTWSYLEDKCEFEPNEDNILVFNFFRNLRLIIEQFSPDKCFFVLEGHPKLRYDLYAEYKGNRIIKTGSSSKQETRDRVFRCKDTILSILRHLPITVCKAEDYEADDVIFTLCENMKDEELIVVSNDSDYIQLLQKGYANCRVYNPIKKEFMSAPSYPYVVWKCLYGDKSDNIPALLKPKKVEDTIRNIELLQEFFSIEENRANFNINRKLIEFMFVPVDDIILVEGIKNYDALRVEFEKLQFNSIITEPAWSKYKNTFDCIKY